MYFDKSESAITFQFRIEVKPCPIIISIFLSFNLIPPRVGLARLIGFPISYSQTDWLPCIFLNSSSENKILF